jgi:hypothetical protein
LFVACLWALLDRYIFGLENSRYYIGVFIAYVLGAWNHGRAW